MRGASKRLEFTGGWQAKKTSGPSERHGRCDKSKNLKPLMVVH